MKPSWKRKGLVVVALPFFVGTDGTFMKVEAGKVLCSFPFVITHCLERITPLNYSLVGLMEQEGTPLLPVPSSRHAA